MTQNSQLILNRYRPIATAGSGGFGTVQVAWDTRIQRKVAIKSIELDDIDAARAVLPGAASPELPWGSDAAGTSADARYDTPDSEAFVSAAASAVVAASAGGVRKKSASRSASNSTSKSTSNSTYAEADDGFTDMPLVHSLAHVPGLDEARTAAMLSDASIVAVYDFEIQGTCAYLIMEYVEGITLTQLLRTYAEDLTLDMVAAVFAAVSHALEVAHANQVLHLDIKPDNVLINRQGQVKVTDFGLATLADASGFGVAGGGTIGYMPLEQMRQESLDARCDEWALASVVYEMLAGENPFIAPDLRSAEAAIEDAELVLPSLCWDELDPAIDDVIFYALDPDREERYDNVTDFAEELEPFLGDAKRGARELAKLVGYAQEDDAEQESSAAQKARTPRIPLVERMSDRALGVIARLFAVAGVALISTVAASNLPWVLGWDSPLLWGLVALCVVGAAIVPHLGVLLAFALWGVSMACTGAPVFGVLLVVLAGVWWWFAGREGSGAACAVLAQPLMGAIGFAGFAPVTAGCFLTVGRAAATAALSAVVAILMSGLAIGGPLPWMGADVMSGWNMFAALPTQYGISSFPGVDAHGFIVSMTQAGIWCTALSWIVAAVAYSLFCVRGTKVFDVMGSVVACALLLAGACGAAWLAAGTSFGDTSASYLSVLLGYLPGALVPGIAGIIVAAMGIPDRARWAAEDPAEIRLR